MLNGAGSTVNFTDGFWSQPRTWNVMGASNKTGDFALGKHEWRGLRRRGRRRHRPGARHPAPKSVQAEDIYVIPDSAHPKRFMLVEVEC